MSIDKIRLFYSVTGADQFHQWLQQWHESVATETTDLIINDIPDAPILRPGADDAEYYTVSLTYPSEETPTKKLEQPYQKLVEYCEWSKVGYHECSDVPDNPTKSNCHYPEDKIQRDGNIPEYIPSLN
jgi:hypothetical protein